MSNAFVDPLLARVFARIDGVAAARDSARR